ncbi:MAG: hypothetical protein AB8B52_07175 [Winogradskyella sp.]|uniref:hypothetical protein n=1 Tax=Winogradskyella sp. TaxID=1883156 RepID=UPI0038581BC5
MELTVNTSLEIVSESIKGIHFTKQGLLNSNYKALVKQNFSKPTNTSVFGMRQRLKAFQLNRVDHTAAILKLSVFLIALVALF